MEEGRLAGAMLVVGLAAFMVGAVRWRFAYEGPQDTALPAIHADRKRRAWFHSWMIAGLMIISAGLAGVATVVDAGAARTLAVMCATAYSVGAVCWVVSLAFGLTVVPWDAERAVADGRPPEAFAALDAALGLAVPGRHQVAFYPPFWALTYPAVVGVTLLVR